MRTITTLFLSLILSATLLAQVGIHPQATASGTDNYTASITTTGFTYATGQRIMIKFTSHNTGACTINITPPLGTPLGAKDIKKNGAQALVANDIKDGQILLLVYDGTNFQVIGDGVPSWGSIPGTLSDQADLENALNAKQASLVSGINIRTIENNTLLGSTNIDLTATDVGLSLVNNTSDASKPVSTLQQAALDLKANLSGGNTLTGQQVISGNSNFGIGNTSPTYAQTITGTVNNKNLLLVEENGGTDYLSIRETGGTAEVVIGPGNLLTGAAGGSVTSTSTTVTFGYLDNRITAHAGNLDLTAANGISMSTSSGSNENIAINPDGTLDITAKNISSTLTSSFSTSVGSPYTTPYCNFSITPSAFSVVTYDVSGNAVGNFSISGNSTLASTTTENSSFVATSDGRALITALTDIELNSVNFKITNALPSDNTNTLLLTRDASGNVETRDITSIVASTITNGVTTSSPSQATVFTALALKANLASPTFTGTPTLPTGTIGTTQVAGNSTTALATTAFVTTADNLKANLASPTFTGTPTLPTGTIAVTQSAANSTTAVATTAFVTTADNLKANLAGPTFTGTVTLPSTTVAVTQTEADNSTKVATTAYADGKISKTLTRNRQTTSYTLVLTDAFKLVEINNASTQTLTVPPNSSVAFTADQTQISIARYGAGAVNVVAGAGVTIRSASGALGLRAQYSQATLIKIGTDEWYLTGDIQ